MPSIVFSNVTLAFTQNMTRESEFGGYNYSFIVDSQSFCDSVRNALSTQKTQIWSESKNTNEFILKKCNAKSRDDVSHEPTRDAMRDTDVLVQVKCKVAPIENSKKVPLGRGTVADILIDVFEYEYGKKQFICIRSHAERGCTVKVTKLKEFSSGPKYFDFEDDTSDDWNSGINANAINEIVESDEEIPY